MTNSHLEDSAELAANLYSGIECLQLLLWRCRFANHEADLGALLEGLEGGMREYMALDDLGRVAGFDGRINEQSIEHVSTLRQLVAEWTRTGTMSPKIETLARECLDSLLGSEAASRLGLPPPSNVRSVDSSTEPLAHAVVVSNLVILLGESFSRRSRSSGEWVILTSPPVWYEPEPVVPDLAGWRADRFPASGEGAILPVPDWVCEVLSPLTALKDRGDKVRDYMAHRVRHGWWIDPVARTFEVFRLEENGRWSILNVFEGDAKVRTEPFDAIELDLSLVWTP